MLIKLNCGLHQLQLLEKYPMHVADAFNIPRVQTAEQEEERYYVHTKACEDGSVMMAGSI